MVIKVERKYKITGIIMMLIYMILSALITLNVIKDNRLLLVIWLSCISVYVGMVPKINSKGKLGQVDKNNFEALIMAIIYYALRYLVGILIFNLGKSPYSFTLRGIFFNISNQVPRLIAREMVRYYLVNTYCSRRNNELAFYSFSALLAACDFNWNLIKSAEDFAELSQLAAREALPAICESILLSFMTLYGATSTPIIYVLASFAFEWLMPILPDLNWFCEGILGTVIPSILISYLTTRNNRKRRRDKMASVKEQVETGFVLAFSVILIWFVVGVFPIYPSVIATGSMEPLIYPGDIILIRQIKSFDEIKALEPGDIIQFRRDNILITHRIIGIEKGEDGQLSFRMKGDNNLVEDIRLVKPDEVRGALLKVIPKLGYPTLLIKERNKPKLDNLEF